MPWMERIHLRQQSPVRQLQTYFSILQYLSEGVRIDAHGEKAGLRSRSHADTRSKPQKMERNLESSL